MFVNEKNMIAGKRSNLFTVSSLRFLMEVFRPPVRRGESGSVARLCNKMLKQVQHDLVIIFSFSVFLLCTNNCFATEIAPGDSTKIKYDINDPRNPYCPCHKYQKLADEEFARLKKKEGNKTGITANNSESSDNSVLKRHRSSFFRYKRKKNNKKLVKVKVVFSKEYWRRWRASTDVANCFHW